MVAIAIVTYRDSARLSFAAALEYVFEQDYPPFEVIVIDSASCHPNTFLPAV